MGRHGHEQHRVERRIEDRSARGERIGGRARRRRADDAVGGLAAHLLAVHVDDEVHHAARAAVAETDVVAREALEDGLALAKHRSLEKMPAVGDALPAKHRRKHRVHVLEHHVGDEPQAPGVDADDGAGMAGDGARHTEHRSVAAQNDGDVAEAPELVARVSLEIAPSRERLGGPVLEHNLVPGGLDGSHQMLERNALALGGLDEYADFLHD